MKFAVINQYGIGIGSKKGKYVYIPKSNGVESQEDCDKWCKKNDGANTCAIIEYTEE